MFKLLKEKLKKFFTSADNDQELEQDIKGQNLHEPSHEQFDKHEKTELSMDLSHKDSNLLNAQGSVHEDERLLGQEVMATTEGKDTSPHSRSFLEMFKIKRTLTQEKFDKLFFDLQMFLLESNVSLESVDIIRSKLEDKVVNKTFTQNLSKVLEQALRDAIYDVLKRAEPRDDILHLANSTKPYIILFFGVNGSGKTTTLAKIANLILKSHHSVVVSASDTFRAAAIDQLESLCNALGVKVIKHNYGSDPAAVAYDAVMHAKSKGIDYVLIDSAGRTNMNENLIQELKKLVRVSKPNKKILVIDSLIGNDAVEQLNKFDQKVGIDGIILTKLDADEKGGTAITLASLAEKPIYYLGVGQGMDDLVKYSADYIIQKIFE